MSRRFLALSLLIAFPLCGMQNVERSVVKYAMTTNFYKKYIKGKTDKAFTLSMWGGIAEGAKQVAEEPGVINTAFQVAQVTAAAGGIGLAAFASPGLVGCACVGMISYMIYDSATSSSAPSVPVTTNIDPSWPTFSEEATVKKYESHTMSPMPPKSPHKEHHRHDPHPHLHPEELKNDRRTKENYTECSDGSLRLKNGAKNPYRTSEGNVVDVLIVNEKIDTVSAYVNKTYVGQFDPVTGIAAEKPKSSRVKTTPAVEDAPVKETRTTVWQMSHSLPIQHTEIEHTPIESPTQLWGQDARDLHYAPTTNHLWSQSWKIGE